MFCVPPPGIHLSLVICIWGYTYHGDTLITSDMYMGIHISRGYTYHCDTGVQKREVFCSRGNEIKKILLLKEVMEASVGEIVKCSLNHIYAVNILQVFLNDNLLS